MIIPTYMDFKDWFSSLVIDFPLDPIPVLYDEKDWKDVGNQLILCDSFYQAGAPGTAQYADPLSWAKDVYLTMVNNA